MLVTLSNNPIRPLLHINLSEASLYIEFKHMPAFIQTLGQIKTDAKQQKFVMHVCLVIKSEIY